MPGHDIIVIGGSAGAVQAVMDIARALPANIPAAVFVVIHTAPSSSGFLAELIDRASALIVVAAADGQEITPGRIYVAPPDHHLLLTRAGIRVTRGPKENGFRPAVDPLFRTAARAFGARVVGVVLSGGLDDGTEGLALIKQHDGIAIVQDPTEAPFPSMPANAIQNDGVDHVVSVAEIPGLLDRLARMTIPPRRLAMSRSQPEPRDVAESGDRSLLNGDLPGSPSGFMCPECGGALWELNNGKLTKYRCHVGHSYTPQGLLEQQTEDVEAAMWTALRALEENAAIRRRMGERSAQRWPQLAREYQKQAREAERRAQLLRTVLLTEKAAAEKPARRRKTKAGGPSTGGNGNGRKSARGTSKSASRRSNATA